MAKQTQPLRILAGDIGGTKTRLGLFRSHKKGLNLISEKTFASGEYKNLEDILTDFIGGDRDISSACFGIAGPLVGPIISRTTNLPWIIHKTSIQKKFFLPKLAIINDLVANAYGISLLNNRDFAILNKGIPKKGNRGLISAGTGLGIAVLFWNGKEHIASPSEGGHVGFGPGNSLEIELLQYLFERFGHVSLERVLSGQGVVNIYNFLKHSGRFGAEPKWLSEKMSQGNPASVIASSARLKKNRICSMAMDMFASIYGAAAGNLALQTMAVNGIYLGGGIAPKITWKLHDSSFMTSFTNKGRFSQFMTRIPVKVILNDRAALMGAAFYALHALNRKKAE
jgi:glucokinase